MISTIFLLVLMAVNILGGYENALSTASEDTYILKVLTPLLHPVNLFDGPSKVSQARTRPSKNIKPTLEQMKYYVNHAAISYAAYHQMDLTCLYGDKIKDDVDEIAIEECTAHNLLALITVSRSRKEIVVAYRGTQDLWNYVIDGLFFNKDIGGHKVHLGFHFCAMQLYEQVMSKVSEFRAKYPEFKIVLTGHSLGAAIARVTLFYLLKLNQFPGAVYEIYTYGEPRVGNTKFAKFFNRLKIVSARIVARADIVPHIPPVSIIGLPLLYDFYVHPQTEYWINGNRSRFCNQSTMEDPTCSASLGPTYTPLDHYIYFDVNMLLTGLTQPAAMAGLPFNLPDVAKILPPLPKPVEDLLGLVGTVGLGLVVPLLGR